MFLLLDHITSLSVKLLLSGISAFRAHLSQSMSLNFNGRGPLHNLPSVQNYQKIPGELWNPAHHRMIALFLFRSAPFPTEHHTEIERDTNIVSCIANTVAAFCYISCYPTKIILSHNHHFSLSILTFLSSINSSWCLPASITISNISNKTIPSSILWLSFMTIKTLVSVKYLP